MTFYSPMGFMFLLTIPAIIALYLLKQRHEEHTVSSLYLWEETLRDIEANSPWQKLRRNLLMILQIAAMLLLVFAVSRPFLNDAGGKASNVVVILDTSMSMQAGDIKPSRFEAARKQASDYISNLRPGTLVTLISMGKNAVIEENMSSDRSRLKNALGRIRVTSCTADIDDTSALVESIAKQHPGTEVVLFGDSDLKIAGVDVKSQVFARSGDNYAITMLSHAVTGNSVTVLSRIGNYGAQDAVLDVSLYADGKVFDARNIRVKHGDTSNVYWNDVTGSVTVLECRIDTKDCLEADNVAWDVVNTAGIRKVMVVSEKNVFIEKYLKVAGGIKLYKTGTGDAEALKGYDLYIFDGFLPEKLPSDGSIMIFNPPQNRVFEVKGEQQLPVLQKSLHNLFKYVDDYTFTIGKSRVLSTPKWAEPVLESDKGVLAFAGTLENRRILVFGFDIHNSDLPLKPVFPVVMTNALEWLLPSGIENTESAYCGQEMEFNLTPKAETARVIAPSGEVTGLAPPFPARMFDGTMEAGRYTLEQKTPEGISRHYFTVNVPAVKESNLAYSPEGNASPGKAAGRIGSPVDTGLNLQGILMWAVLLLLCIEWWVYSNGV